MDFQTSFGFAAGLALTTLGAWLCFNRLAAAKDSGKFLYIFHGVAETKSPMLFQACRVFLTIQAYVFSLMAVVVVIAFVISMLGNFR